LIFAAEVFIYLKEIIDVMRDIEFSEANLLLSSVPHLSNPLLSQRAGLTGFVLGNSRTYGEEKILDAVGIRTPTLRSSSP
jgi:hypothetical protein